MNYQDSVRIFATGVEDARREQQTRSQELGPVVDLKLTVDLSKRGLHEIPDEVVELLKVEVERWVIPLWAQLGFANIDTRRQSSSRPQSHSIHPRYIFAMSSLEIPEFTGQLVPGVPTTSEKTRL